MPPISHRLLYWSTMATALAGQFLLDTNPKPAILLCGIALVLALLDGWWYLAPIGSNWWYTALFGVLGLTMWQEPRGWFFMAWAAVIIGTGLRAQTIYRRFTQVMDAERARVQRLEELGFEPDSPFAGVRPVEPPPAVKVPPVPLWRYPLALVLGVAAAWFGAWCTRVFFLVTGIQLDLLAYFIGYLVGKAVAAGAGERSNRLLQGLAALCGALGVLYGRYLLLRWVLFDGPRRPVSHVQLFEFVRLNPGKTLGMWLVVFVALGAWTGWRYAAARRAPPELEESA
ncbi:MAG TPA: hypothetical protein VNT75_25515 [Symbiobacteriaceae bacterium]|nr:hypothetical protein [Symbiobacteriaceae bacterium]